MMVSDNRIGDSKSLHKTMVQMALKNCPIQTRAEAEKNGYISSLIPMDKEWKKRVASNWWGTGYQGSYPDSLLPLLTLRDRLLCIDGQEVCMPVKEPDLENIMEYGQLWIGQRHVKMMEGEPNHCHQNAAYLWRANQNHPVGIFGIATGYALSKDSMWRQHTWCVWRKPRSYQIIETTAPRELYYGVCMLGAEAEDFCQEVLWDE